MPFSGKMSSCFRLSFISLKSILFNDHAASSSRIPECFDLEESKRSIRDFGGKTACVWFSYYSCHCMEPVAWFQIK
jgi:hypothetical protein